MGSVLDGFLSVQAEFRECTLGASHLPPLPLLCFLNSLPPSSSLGLPVPSYSPRPSCLDTGISEAAELLSDW